MDTHKKYEDLLNDLIQKRIEQRKTKKNEIQDMLDIFLDSYENQSEKFKITIEMIRQNFEALLLAGIDTSSHVACMALYNLAKHS